ncbi:amidohydrolase family protein [Paenibacillus sp. GCM10023252]|uniref:amidohydrolase family protein n=1 Tax=Paenibacillus sp. GCM10023252 TaxID=3252649 RepID=UPI003615E5D4
MDSKSNKSRRIIDCDIHHQIRSTDDLLPYLSSHYRSQVETWGLQLPALPTLNGGVGGRRVDSFPPSGNPPASEVPFTVEQLFEPFNVEYGILTGEFQPVTTTPDANYAAALCAAYNDYTIEHWLEKDSRMKGSIMLPIQNPLLAAKEIERVGSHKDMVQAIAPSGARALYGQRVYDPIYEACERYGLPFTIHIGMEGFGINPSPTGAGHPSYYIEYRSVRPQLLMAHLASFIFEGVFERFPSLKVVMLEAGVFWVVPYLWRLDQDWKALRYQTPWVTKKPSEYFMEHVFIGSQPIETGPSPAAFKSMLEWMNGKDKILFCSDYPHWDFDSPAMAFPKLDEETMNNIHYNNAAKLYGLKPAAREAAI